MRRWAERRDKAEADIVQALRAYGATVAYLSAPGLPDLLVGYQGNTILLEVKSSRGKVSAAQQEWHVAWCGGPLAVVRNADEAIRVLK